MTTKRTPKPKRYEYHVTYDKAANLWVCKVGDAAIGYSLNRYPLVSKTAYWLGRFNDELGQHSELIIHTKRGTIGKGSSSRRTYGADPKSKG